MKTIVTVKFNREERQTIDHAYTHIGIAYPDHYKADSKRDSQRESRVLGGLVRGEPVTNDQLRRALTAIEKLRERCVIESDRTYWDEELKAPQDPHPTSLAGSVGLIAPGHDVAAVLAETRLAQLRDVEAAHDLIVQALMVCPASPEEDE